VLRAVGEDRLDASGLDGLVDVSADAEDRRGLGRLRSGRGGGCLSRDRVGTGCDVESGTRTVVAATCRCEGDRDDAEDAETKRRHV
jgi:hypothetical protein